MSLLTRKIRGFRLVDVVALGVLVAVILSVYLAKTMAGKMIYPIADLFIVQWESMLKVYPDAVYGGWIF